jgi:hypothetical protein
MVRRWRSTGVPQKERDTLRNVLQRPVLEAPSSFLDSVMNTRHCRYHHPYEAFYEIFQSSQLLVKKIEANFSLAIQSDIHSNCNAMEPYTAGQNCAHT